MPIKFSGLCVKVLESQTCHASAGTRTTHAHGLGYAPDIDHIICQSLAADDDANALDGSVALVKVDATNVYVKSNTASQTFNMFIFLEKDQGNQRTV